MLPATASMLKALESKHRSEAKRSEAKRSEAKRSEAKRSEAKRSEAKRSPSLRIHRRCTKPRPDLLLFAVANYGDDAGYSWIA